MQIKVPPKLAPVFVGEARYRCAYGGRGSGKTRTFAKMAALRGAIFAQEGRTGVILCGREFQNSLEESSFAEVKEAIMSEPWLLDQYDIGDKFIRTRCKKVHFSFSGLRRNIDSIKSKAKILIIWVDEAEPVTEIAWRKITPTIREQGSEIWVTWNPEQKKSATHKRFRENPPNNAKIVEINWRDNPWFTKELNEERLNDRENRPDQYTHVWDGDFLTVSDSAYFAKHIIKAKEQKRWDIDVPCDPLFVVRLFADIGGTGAKSDNFVFWAAQFSGQNINWINHYEVQGQPLGHHLDWLRSQDYEPSRAKIFLPHDGATNDKVIDISYESAFIKAGYKVEVIPNQGRGAAKQRIEAIRNNFSRMHFDKKCSPGMDALAWYHEKIDEQRGIGLGPEHDWSSHSADAAGLGAICWEPPKAARKMGKPKIGGIV